MGINTIAHNILKIHHSKFNDYFRSTIFLNKLSFKLLKALIYTST